MPDLYELRELESFVLVNFVLCDRTKISMSNVLLERTSDSQEMRLT